MKHTVARSLTSTCKKIKSYLLLKGANVSISTISCRLSKKFGLKSYKLAKKPQLISQMKKKRLELAMKHIDWSVEDWTKVLLLDEFAFQQFTVRKNHVYSPVGERFYEKYIISTMKHPPTQIIQGAMSAMVQMVFIS